MSYVIDDSVLNSSTEKTWIDAGINSDIELSHKVEITENGNAFFEYAYSNKHGKKVTRTEWEMKPLRPYAELTPKLQATLDKMVASDKNDTTTVQEAAELFIAQKKRGQMQRIIEVASLFVPKKELLGFQGDTFLEFIRFISESIGDKSKGVKLRVKFVFNYRGFVDTPDYVRAGDPWIEREDEVPTEKSLIKINAGKDQLTRPEPKGSRPPKGDSPLEDSTNTVDDLKPAGADEDLPF